MDYISLVLPKLTTCGVGSKQMPQFGSRLLGSNRELEVYSASGTVLGKGISSWVPRHIFILQMLRV